MYPSDLLYLETKILDVRQLYSIQGALTQVMNKKDFDRPIHQYATERQYIFILPLMTKNIGKHINITTM